jgi:anti-sigma regulatory factor (Ser/Thr protein kinase)
VQLLASDSDLKVRIGDEGASRTMLEEQEPSIEAKLAGSQPSRGWGLFLIRNMVDEVRVASDEGRHVLEMVVHREAIRHGR